MKASLSIRVFLIGLALAAGVATVARAADAATAKAAPKAAAPPAARTVVLAADTWCPVNCAAKQGVPGYAVEMARAALGPAGYTVEYRIMPWGRAVEAARAGRIDGVIGTVPSETPDFVLPKETIGRNTNVFFVREDSTWRYRGIHSLEGHLVGVASDYDYGQPFDDYVQRFAKDPSRINVIHSLNPVAQGVRLVQAGRIDAYVDDRQVVNWTLLRDPSLGKVRESGLLSEVPLYIAFTPATGRNGRALADAFDRGVKQLRAKGSLAEILARYGVRDWAGVNVQQ